MQNENLEYILEMGVQVAGHFLAFLVLVLYILEQGLQIVKLLVQFLLRYFCMSSRCGL